MPRCVRLTTPPQELIKNDDASPQLETPRRAAILSVLYYCQEKKLPCSLQSISTVFNIHPSTVSRVVASRRCRRLQHSDEHDPRGRPRRLTVSDAAAISTYIEQAPFHEKSDSWLDLAERSGVVKEYRHERGVENLQWSAGYIQRRVSEYSGIKTHKAVTKEAHEPSQLESRKAYIDSQLCIRPNARDWRKVVWCDEIHWMTGPRYQRSVKRLPGKFWKYHPSNIQYEKDHKPDPMQQRHFHIFSVLGYDFAWAIPYTVRARNGKMNDKVYTEHILPQLQAYFLERGGEWILWQDRDSAHTSKYTQRWMDLHGMDYIISPPKSQILALWRLGYHQYAGDFGLEDVQQREKV